MAIVQNPITGRTKKKFGTAVFSKQFGKNVMRSKPMEVKNPQTVGQVTQRNKFATTVDLVRQVLPLINKVYAGSLSKMSPFNKVPFQATSGMKEGHYLIRWLAAELIYSLLVIGFH